MSRPHILTYIDAIREAEKRSEANDIPIYLIPIHGFRLTESLDEASEYSDAEVIRVRGPKHTAGVR